MRLFVPSDLVVGAEQEAQLVDPFQQAMAGERGQGEAPRLLADEQPLRRDVHDGNGVGMQGKVFDERGVRFPVELHRDDPVLERVVAKNVGERWGDNGLEAEIGERPWGVLS